MIAKRVIVGVDDLTAEFAYAVQSLCDECNCSQEEWRQFTWMGYLWHPKYTNRFRHIRQLPIKIVIPDHMACKHEIARAKATSSPHLLSLTSHPNPALCDPRELGLHEFAMKTDSGEIRIWRFRTFRDDGPLGKVVHFIHKNDIRIFYKAFFQWEKEIEPAYIPVLDPRDLKEIYDNSIGFLEEEQKNKEKYKEFRIPCKRGILLSGKPGCGKTMTCKWLRRLCIEKKYEYKIVTYEDYRSCLAHGTVASLFQLPLGRKGVIFFDDMDILFQDREKGNTHLQTFLTQLDGIEPTGGVVFVFTSNRIGDDLDKAFVRPGRVDIFILFRPPTKKLRERFVKECFHPDLLKLVDVDDIVNRAGKENDDSESYSFAELEEIRKLLSIDMIAGKEVSVDRIFKVFEKHRKDFEERAKFGFGKLENGDGDAEGYPEYYNEDLLPFLPASMPI